VGAPAAYSSEMHCCRSSQVKNLVMYVAIDASRCCSCKQRTACSHAQHISNAVQCDLTMHAFPVFWVIRNSVLHLAASAPHVMFCSDILLRCDYNCAWAPPPRPRGCLPQPAACACSPLSASFSSTPAATQLCVNCLLYLLPAAQHSLCTSFPAAMILGGGAGTDLWPLTNSRAEPAVPFAGLFRLIDVPLSNCIHSGISNIYVLTQYNATRWVLHGACRAGQYSSKLSSMSSAAPAGRTQRTLQPIVQFWRLNGVRSCPVDVAAACAKHVISNQPGTIAADQQGIYPTTFLPTHTACSLLCTELILDVVIPPAAAILQPEPPPVPRLPVPEQRHVCGPRLGLC
jgi:hypothetical protein